MSRIDDLYDIAINMTNLMVQEGNEHLQEHWYMIFGSVLIPELMKEDPKVFERHPQFKTLADAFTKEEVLAKLAPKVETVEKTVEVEKVVEKPVIVEKEVPVPVEGSTARKDPGHAPCKEGGKYRRLKDEGINKLKRKKRSIDADVRDTIIRWWNDAQRLVCKDDPICQKLADECNVATPHMEPLSALQIAGYLSRLADWGRLSASHREEKFDRHEKKKLFTVRPVYSEALIAAIIENYNEQREDERIRKEAQARMRAEKAAAGGYATPEVPEASTEKVEVKGSLDPEAPAAAVSTEEPSKAAPEADEDIKIEYM